MVSMLWSKAFEGEVWSMMGKVREVCSIRVACLRISGSMWVRLVLFGMCNLTAKMVVEMKAGC